MRNDKILMAGVAALLIGALLGWGISHWTGNARATSEDSLMVNAPADGASSLDVKEPGGSITPSQPYRGARPSAPRSSGAFVPAGTAVAVAVNGDYSTKTSSVGESWSGTVAQDVYHNGRVVIPAGSPVYGVISESVEPQRGERARLRLSMTSVSVDGRRHTVRGSSETIVAGSPRTRNVGAIAGGTAAGALIGHAVGGSTKGTVIGGLLGGAAATGAVAASKGYQATIKDGRQITFTTH